MPDLRASTHLERNPLSVRAYMAARSVFYWNTGTWPEQRTKHQRDYNLVTKANTTALLLMLKRRKRSR